MGDMGGVVEVELRKMAVDGRELDKGRLKEGLLDRGLTEESSKQLIVARSSNDLIELLMGSKCRLERDCSEESVPLRWTGTMGNATVSNFESDADSPSSDRSITETFDLPEKRILSSLEKCCLRIFSGRDKNHWASAWEMRYSAHTD